MPEIVWNPRLEHLTSQTLRKLSRSCCGQHSNCLVFKAITTFQSGNQSKMWFFNFLSVVSVPRGFFLAKKKLEKACFDSHISSTTAAIFVFLSNFLPCSQYFTLFFRRSADLIGGDFPTVTDRL